MGESPLFTATGVAVRRAGARRDAGARNLRARRPCSPDFRHLACRRYGTRRTWRTRRTRRTWRTWRTWRTQRTKRASVVGERTRLAVMPALCMVPASRGRCRSHPCLFLRVLRDLHVLRVPSFLRTTRRTSSMEIRVTSFFAQVGESPFFTATGAAVRRAGARRSQVRRYRARRYWARRRCGRDSFTALPGTAAECARRASNPATAAARPMACVRASLPWWLSACQSVPVSRDSAARRSDTLDTHSSRRRSAS